MNPRRCYRWDVNRNPRDAGEPWAPGGLGAWVEEDDRDLAVRARLIHGVAVVSVDHLRPPDRSLIRIGGPGADRPPVAEDLRVRFRIREQIQVPVRMLIPATPGCDDNEAVVVPQIEERHGVLLPGSAPSRCEQADVVVDEAPTDGSAGAAIQHPMER